MKRYNQHNEDSEGDWVRWENVKDALLCLRGYAEHHKASGTGLDELLSSIDKYLGDEENEPIQG